MRMISYNVVSTIVMVIYSTDKTKRKIEMLGSRDKNRQAGQKLVETSLTFERSLHESKKTRGRRGIKGRSKSNCAIIQVTSKAATIATLH